MITEKLVGEKESIVTNFSEALELVNSDFLVEKYETDLNELDLEDDGIVAWPGNSYPLTDWAFESICSLLRIPKEFARRIPFELLLQNFNRLKDEHNQRINIFISHETMVNIIPHPYICAKNEDMLMRLEKIAEIFHLELHEIRLSNRGMSISILKEGMKAELIPGDITRFGISILNSETGYRGAKANFYLLRLICTNGATLSNSWGNVTWSYDHRISYEHSLQIFFDRIQNLEIDFTKFEDTYRGLINRELVAFELVNVFRSVSRIVGDEEADQIFKIAKDDRNNFMDHVRDGNRMILTGVILYDLYNSITEAARKHRFVERRKLEVVGGGLIDMFLRG